MPMQVGPKEKDLQKIEAIRDREREAHLAKQKAKAQKRARKTSKDKKSGERIHNNSEQPGLHPPDGELGRARKRPRNGNTDPSTLNASNSEPGRPGSPDGFPPFANLNNGTLAGGAIPDSHVMAVHQSQAGRTRVNAVNASKRKIWPSAQPFDSEGRIIVLVLWDQSDQVPFVDRVTIPTHDGLFLFHHPRIRGIPAPTQFERYVFNGNVWSPVPWDITPIEVDPEDDIIFVRIMGIQCREFGQQLHNYQLDRGHALPINHRLEHVFYEPPKRHRWFLVWHKNHEPPKRFLVDFREFDEERATLPVPRPWLDVLHDAPFFLVWHELHTRWHGFHRNQSPPIPEDAPMILLAHPGVETLAGSGEAIAWLETWRAAHQSAQPEIAPVQPSYAHLPKSKSVSGSGSTRTQPRKTHVPLAANARAISISDDEPEVESHLSIPPRTPSKTTPGVLENRARAAASRSTWVIDISDDDSEFVQGSSSSPLKTKAREREGGYGSARSAGEIIDLTGK
uniref:Inosine-5'-monophosphate dehydrogenase (IMP dehydrogenase) (IMPD) (IMPDH) (EC) n=1 Tax=Ganoderma boninense TaxID=34458 RepID=A0A5K1JYG8_9APHY|nr:Inosine-5'-monophosphate dehydrogenase (IMP dehydrogenase) (IMPD) (IMPDH) (EC [Ganoderma boninense]